MSKILYFLLFISIHSYYSQSIVVQYEVMMKPQESFLSNEQVPQSVKQNYLSSIKQPSPFVLLVSNGKSFFGYGTYNFKESKIEKPFSKNSFQSKDDEYFRNIDAEELLQFQRDVKGAFYVVYKNTLPENIQPIGSEKIDNFLCKVYERKDDPSVYWVAEEIPVNAGPSFYYGFPGLVLKAESLVRTIYATSINFLDESIDVPLPDDTLRRVSEEDFVKELKSRPTIREL
ncbi:GLPGLI family protein [Riemerella anatipestifer]|uniref:GLPGLI family protein n=1 Tax=Riemerella anatipestifer TaxID=34085 RepID=UPI0012AD744C|nr:GLPGLI family protein [Riemerella anatipestifer]MCO7319135.1 GLPGLI family protein [Riemerella anatipestifer]MCQ4155423.1 GLPGLI family protein [Riemerella anatipestifer]MCQ4181371.1 GLPGLI family protein [Riemerella anatipestifer]MCW0474654.1 GLPGLI family protein [Riemerella anatipestifer]MDR7775502.1 GLPGLI family protein [Riemerella anatipestifer]